MGGLARIAKMYGGITINGERIVWDYVADVAVPVEEMPVGSDRWNASEKRKMEIMQAELQHLAASGSEGK
jgi:hypothetical protein